MHHLFGGETCDIVRRAYGDAYLAAHFEVPGEMFSLAMEVGRGEGAAEGAGREGEVLGRAQRSLGPPRRRSVLKRAGSGVERGGGSWRQPRARAQGRGRRLKASGK